MSTANDQARRAQPRSIRLGSLQVQQHTDWRCTSVAWRRGRWRPVVHLRIGPATKPALGGWLCKDEEGMWELNVAIWKADLIGMLTGPWK